MARIVVRCEYTGHFVTTGIDTRTMPPVTGGRIFCPYCTTHHVWNCGDDTVRLDESLRPRPLVRKAS